MLSKLNQLVPVLILCFLVGTLGLGEAYAQVDQAQGDQAQEDQTQDEDEQAKEDQAKDDQAKDDQAQDKPPELSDMELIERVAFLQRELESPEIPKRDAAEKELIQHGVRVLDYLEAADEKTTTQAVERLGRVRQHLEKIAVAAVTKASLVNFSGTISVDKALEKIRNQTGNDVKLPDGAADLFRDREIKVEFKDAKFWEALSEVMKQGELDVDTYGGEPGKLIVVPTEAARIAAANPDMPKQKKKAVNTPRNVSGIFDLAVTRVNASRNLRNPAQNYCNIDLLIRWEPRVNPISIVLPASTIKAIDEFDAPIEITNKEAVMSGTVQREIPELEFSVPIGLLDRQIEEVKSFDAVVDAVLPGRVETFKFKNLGKLEPGASQLKGGATVTFEGFAKNEELWGVSVGLSFDEEHNALESHQGWVFDNPIHLENKDGEKYEYLALEGVRQTNTEVVVRYFFDQNPENLSLHYTTPAAIVKVPVKISLKKIPLP